MDEPTYNEFRAVLSDWVEATPHRLLLLDPKRDYRIVYANEAACRHLGLSLDEVLRLKAGDFEPAFAPPQRAATESELASRRRIDLESVQRIPGAGQVPVQVNAFALSSGAREYVALAIVDIHERKQAETRMVLLYAALEAAANAIAIVDLEGRIVWANPSFAAMTGYAPQEFLGKHISMLKSSLHPVEFYRDLWTTVLAGQVWRGEVRNRRKDGTIYDEEMTITPVKNGHGRIIRFIAVKQEVTRRKEMERQLLRAQRMEGIGMLAGGIAHDLNNVLAPILLSAEMLRSECSGERAAQLLETIEAGARRGAGIVRQVLTFARGIEGERVAIDPRRLIEDMAAVVRETFPKDIRLEVRVQDDLPTFVGDSTQLHQVLLNLCVNARDAMPDGGVLELAAGQAHLGAGPDSGVRDGAVGPYVTLAVSDTGCGIPPEVVERLFEPFFTTKPRGQGTGLGLSVAYGIARNHGGFIQVRSEPGRGSRFTVYLPARGSPAPAPEERPGPRGRRGTGQLILVVDDEKEVRESVAAVLAAKNYRIVVARHGEEALELYRTRGHDVALVITDVMMPVGDGASLCREIRRINPAARILVATGAVVGQRLDDKLADLRELGLDRVLRKPFAANELLERIGELMPDRED